MKRVLKWLTFALVGLIATTVVAVVIINLYKKDILVSINEKLKESVNGDFNIGDYNITIFHSFPDISITLKEIYLHGPGYEKYRRSLMKAQRVDINVEPLKLFSKEISVKSVDIKEAEIFVFRTTDGYTNLDVFKKVDKTDSLTPVRLLDFKEINLQNVQVTYHDSLKRKNAGLHFIDATSAITLKDSSSLFHVGGEIMFDGLLLNELKGSFLKNKSVEANLNMELDTYAQNLIITPSTLQFEKSLLNLSGNFLLVAPATFGLDVESNKMDFIEGLSILPDSLAKRLGKYQIEKPVKVKVKVNGVLEPGDKPAVDVIFSIHDSDITAGKLIMNKMSMEGLFTNHVDSNLIYDDKNSQLHFASMDGILDNMPIKAVATLTDLTDPTLKLKATFEVELKSLNEHLDTTKIRMDKGHFVSNFSYVGKLQEYFDESRTSYEGKLTGEAKITNGNLQHVTRKIAIGNVNALFGFTEKQFEIKSLKLTLNKNQVSLKGSITDFVPFFTNPAETGKANLSISSPRLDIATLLQPRKIQKSKSAKAASKKKLDDLFEKLNEKLEFNIYFTINEFIKNDFKATHARGRLLLANNRFSANNTTMDFANGKVEFNLKINNLQRLINPVQLDARVRNVEIKQFFYAFNNFKQTTIRHDHLDGKLNLDVSLSAEINEKFEFQTPKLVGTASFKIQNGRLSNFEPMERLSNFLFKNRDFSDVQFAEITSEIKMSGTKMNVSRMAVESTVMTMFIEGQYDLKDSSDLSIQIPISNLKKRDQNFAPENIGDDSKAGPSVFLRVRTGKDGKANIAYDPFKKFRKKKKESKPR